METKIKVTDKAETLEGLKPGDMVKSIQYGAVILVIGTDLMGGTFDGFVLKKGDYVLPSEKTFSSGFYMKNFVPFHGVVTLTSE